MKPLVESKRVADAIWYYSVSVRVTAEFSSLTTSKNENYLYEHIISFRQRASKSVKERKKHECWIFHAHVYRESEKESDERVFSRKNSKLFVWVLPWASKCNTNKWQEKKIPTTSKKCEEHEFRITRACIYNWNVTTREIQITIATVQANKQRQRKRKKEFLLIHDHPFHENVGKRGQCRHSVCRNSDELQMKALSFYKCIQTWSLQEIRNMSFQ